MVLTLLSPQIYISAREFGSHMHAYFICMHIHVDIFSYFMHSTRFLSTVKHNQHIKIHTTTIPKLSKPNYSSQERAGAEDVIKEKFILHKANLI